MLVRFLITYLCSLSLVAGFSAWAADETEWPDQLDFPPAANWQNTHQPLNQPANQAPSTQPKAEPKTEASHGKGKLSALKKMNPFKRKPKEAPAPTEEQVTKVGPRDFPARPDPLLRLPMKLKIQDLTVMPGFYLVRQLSHDPSNRELALTQQNRIIAKFTVRPISKQAQPDSGAISKVDPKVPAPVSMDTRISPDHQSVVILLKEGESRYESDPFPTQLDQRPVISY